VCVHYYYYYYYYYYFCSSVAALLQLRCSSVAALFAISTPPDARLVVKWRTCVSLCVYDYYYYTHAVVKWSSKLEDVCVL
jgi:hypothetical protein